MRSRAECRDQSPLGEKNHPFDSYIDSQEVYNERKQVKKLMHCLSAMNYVLQKVQKVEKMHEHENKENIGKITLQTTFSV